MDGGAKVKADSCPKSQHHKVNAPPPQQTGARPGEFHRITSKPDKCPDRSDQSLDVTKVAAFLFAHDRAQWPADRQQNEAIAQQAH